MRCRAEPQGNGPKRGKDKKKKKRQKVSVSSAEGDTNLVSKQGLNVPRPTSLPVEVSSPHTRRHLPPANDDAFPDLGSNLPNLDSDNSRQAMTDEMDWQRLDEDLMQEPVEDLMQSRSQAPASITSAELTILTNLGQTSPITRIQRALSAAHTEQSHEEGGRKIPIARSTTMGTSAAKKQSSRTIIPAKRPRSRTIIPAKRARSRQS